MDQLMNFVEPGRVFAKDSIRLVKRCTKPDRKEFQKIAMATAIGFAIMALLDFLSNLFTFLSTTLLLAANEDKGHFLMPT